MLARVIEEMKLEGRKGLTFGTSATEEFHPEANLGGWRVNMMKKGYKMVTKKTGLTKRGDFRVRSPSASLHELLLTPRRLQAKFETQGEPLYVCFPPHGFGISGLVALMKMLRA